MNFFNALTTAFLPKPELTCPRELWYQLLDRLRERGRFGQRESGAFLLGHRANRQARILQFALYDDLDPCSLELGIVHFDGRYYGALWELCRRSGLTVVADVHTHPFGPQQSVSDRAHPMISAAGHIALILPRFAIGDVPLEAIGMYRYLGAKRWYSVPTRRRSAFLQLAACEVAA